MIEGTMGWMSPEQMTGGIVSRQADIYGFAMTMYEVSSVRVNSPCDFTTVPYSQIFTGRPPFSNISASLLHDLVVTQQKRPRKPEELVHGMDEDVWTLINRSWVHAPGLRPLASSVRAELERLVAAADASGISTLGTEPSHHERRRPSTSEHLQPSDLAASQTTSVDSEGNPSLTFTISGSSQHGPLSYSSETTAVGSTTSKSFKSGVYPPVRDVDESWDSGPDGSHHREVLPERVRSEIWQKYETAKVHDFGSGLEAQRPKTMDVAYLSTLVEEE